MQFETPVLPELRRSERNKYRPKISYKENDIELLTCAKEAILKIPFSYQEIIERDDKTKCDEAINNEIIL